MRRRRRRPMLLSGTPHDGPASAHPGSPHDGWAHTLPAHPRSKPAQLTSSAADSV